MKITIYGASDDLVEVYGCDGADEFNTYERSALMWHGDLRAPDGTAMRVNVLYDDGGCWSVAVGQVDEDTPFPAWPVVHRQEGSYSTAAVVDAPEGTELVNVWPAREGDDG